MIINGYEQYNELQERMNRERCILTPVFRDLYYHPQENTLLCVGISFDNSDFYLLSISHEDAPRFELPIASNGYTSNSTHLPYNTVDLMALFYVHGTELQSIKYDPYVHDVHNMFGTLNDVNKVIPLTVWSKVLREYNKYLLSVVDTFKLTDSYHSTYEMIRTLRNIESQGMYVNKALLVEKFGKKADRNFKTNFVYSQYNPYTITGRPSNRFGGINFSALNKSDGSRDVFISRYEDGQLLQLDFEAYHLRLVADEFNIPLPQTSLHKELAKAYFGVEEITDDLYKASKQKTFEIMYGMSSDTYGIGLFERIVEIRKQYENTSGELILPSGMTVNVSDPNASKMFNYYIQSLEVVKTIPKLQKIINLLKNTTNHLVLYTYDSILLDVKDFDSELISSITSILEDGGKFPVRLYAGKTYGTIEEVI